MVSIKLIAVGKLKEEYLRAASAEYAKRLQAFCDLKIIEIDECRLSDRPSDKEIKNALETEAKAIMKHAGGFIIPMCIEGRQMKRYGDDPQYNAYADSTPIIIPFLPVYHLNKK